MAATPSIRVIKTFTYRGSPRRWSNRYHFNGGTPADGSHWSTLSDAIVTAEKAIFPSTIYSLQIVQTIGYAAGSEVPVFTKNYTTNGTATFTGQSTPGDVAALIRYATAARTRKNHPVYLFNYYHAMQAGTGTSFDAVLAAQITLLTTYANAWLAGFSDGTNTYVRAGPNGAAATGVFIEPNLTHRDLHR